MGANTCIYVGCYEYFPFPLNDLDVKCKAVLLVINGVPHHELDCVISPTIVFVCEQMEMPTLFGCPSPLDNLCTSMRSC